MRVQNLALISVVAVLIGGSSAAMADGYGYRQPSIQTNQTVVVQIGDGYAPRRCDPVFGCPNDVTPTDELIEQTHTRRERHWDR